MLSGQGQAYPKKISQNLMQEYDPDRFKMTIEEFIVINSNSSIGTWSKPAWSHDFTNALGLCGNSTRETP